jgi:flavin-dependent dehydrogenase
MNQKTIKIGGAGIAGLTAAINLAKAGFSVEVYDRAEDSGNRFHGDYQGIENWSGDQDVLDLLKEMNIEINFDYHGTKRFSVWAPKDFKRNFQCEKPLFYLVRRGIEKNSLDQGLKEQALKHNVKIFYQHPITDQEVNIVATGPFMKDLAIDGLALGYTFDTNLKELNIGILNDNYALDGYSYFLIHNGKGTIATAIAGNYKDINTYAEKTLSAFQKYYEFDMENIRKFSGKVNFFLPKIPKDKKIYIGEAGGFQDYLWGFGMKYAMQSGYLAAKSIIENRDFYELSKGLTRYMKISVVNRFVFKMLGNKSYRFLAKYYAGSIKNPILFVKKLHKGYWCQKLLFPLAKIALKKYIRDPRDIKT